jgi:hypothetical protein
MKKYDIVKVLNIRSLRNTGTVGWFGKVGQIHYEDGKEFVMVWMQGETSPRLYSKEDLVVIKEGSL